MDLRLVEIFCHVCEEKSFSRAASRLRLSQPTVSSHIRTLERQVGAVLLDRPGRAVTPTRVGALLYEHGQRILEAKRALIEDLDRLLNRLEGQLPIGASTIPGEYLLAPLIGEFRAAYPRIEIKLRIRNTAEILGNVRNGRIELGFVGSRLAEFADLQFEDFGADRLVLVAPVKGKWDGRAEVGINELCRYPLIMREPGSGTRATFERRLEQLGRSPLALNVVAEMGSTSAVKQAVLAGIGLAVLSYLAVQSEVKAGLLRIVPIAELGTLERRFFTAIHAHKNRSPLGEALLAWLAAHRPAPAGPPAAQANSHLLT
jgi:DNA-binding transcriptional LysR family regulator